MTPPTPPPPQEPGDEAFKLHIDSDWKSQAQAEKQRLAEQTESHKKSPAAAGGGSAASGAASTESGKPRAGAADEPAEGTSRPHEEAELPPANWETLVSMMATQAIMYLGGYVDPQTNRAIVDLEAARHQIDLLGVLEEKTKGNLTPDEQKQLAGILHELRTQYVRIVQAVVRQQQQQGMGGIGGMAGGPDMASFGPPGSPMMPGSEGGFKLRG